MDKINRPVYITSYYEMPCVMTEHIGGSFQFCVRTLLTGVISWVITGLAIAQDLPERKNSISLSILPLLDRTVALTYARKLKNGNEFIVTPRIRLAREKVDGNSFGPINFNDPQWFYDHYQLRTGLMLRDRAISFEPQLQLGYSAFSNRLLITTNYKDDAYEKSVLLNRNYFSAGIINFASFPQDFDRLRVKWFLGVGLHARWYHQTLIAEYTGRNETVFPTPLESDYAKLAYTFHIGFDLGLRY